MTVQTLTQFRSRAASTPWLIVALATAVALLVSLPPVYLVLRAGGEGADAWERITDSSTIAAILRTIWLTATVTSSCIVLGVALAWLTARTDLPGRGIWVVLAALPLAVPSFVGGFVVVSALGPRGLLQDLLEPLGVDRLPSLYGFTGSWLTLTFLTYPYVYLPVRAALRRIDPAPEEAARGLGHSALEAFGRVLLPQLRPAIVAGALLVALYSLSEFGAVSLLRYDTLSPLVYIQYTAAFDRGSAAVLALPLLFLAILVLVVEGTTRGRVRYHGSSQARPPTIARLGRWRWPALGFCASVVAIGVGLPVGVVAYWLVRGLTEGESMSFVRDAVIHSSYASALAAICATAAAMPIALLSTRHSGWLSGLLEKVTYAVFALPAITIALSLVFFAANYTSFIYQTLALLVFAYVVHFLPQAIGACRSSLLQINPNTEEAARGLGLGPLRVFARITVPQIMPGMTTGALLVFLTVMKELPATLLLSPIGFDTLSVQVWSATTEAFFTRAALPALILILVSSIPVGLMVWQERTFS